MSETQQTDDVELEKDPEEILDGLIIGLVETGEKFTVSTDQLDAEGVLLIEEKNGDVTRMTPAELEEWMYVMGMYYVPEYSPAWEVDEALSQLAESEQESDK